MPKGLTIECLFEDTYGRIDTTTLTLTVYDEWIYFGEPSEASLRSEVFLHLLRFARRKPGRSGMLYGPDSYVRLAYCKGEPRRTAYKLETPETRYWISEHDIDELRKMLEGHCSEGNIDR